MTAGGADLDSGLRRRLALCPGDPEVCADIVRALDDRVAVFAWFRRIATLTEDPDGDVLRKAVDAARAAEAAVLSRFAASAGGSDRIVRPFVAAALLVSGHVDAITRASTPLRYADARNNVERAIALLAAKTLPGSLKDTFEIMIGKQEIGSLLLNAGYVPESIAMDLNTSGFIRSMQRALNGDGPRYMTNHWTFAIGHMVLFAFLVRGQEAGVFDFRGIRVWQGRPANWYLWTRIRQLSPDLQVVPQVARFADNHYSRNFEWVDGRFVDYLETCGIVADRAGDARGAILDRPDPDHPLLVRFRQAAGIAPDEPIVTLHCREAGFRDDARHDLRNVDVAGYLPAMRALVERGHRVVRLGDPTMTRLPETPGVVDYAVSPLKSAELDLLLPAVARFHVGSSSGLSLAPLLYGTPCLFLNWYPIDMLPWGRRNWTVMKPIEALGDSRRVIDLATYSVLGRMRRRQLLAIFGHEACDLRPAEVERAVLAFAADLDAGADEPPKAGRNIGRLLVVDDHGRFLDLAPDSPLGDTAT